MAIYQNFTSFGNDSHPNSTGSSTAKLAEDNTILSTETDNSVISGLRATPNIQPHDLVPVKEVTTTPLHWPIAYINNIHPHQMASCVCVTLRNTNFNTLTITKFQTSPHEGSEI